MLFNATSNFSCNSKIFANSPVWIIHLLNLNTIYLRALRALSLNVFMLLRSLFHSNKKLYNCQSKYILANFREIVCEFQILCKTMIMKIKWELKLGNKKNKRGSRAYQTRQWVLFSLHLFNGGKFNDCFNLKNWHPTTVISYYYRRVFVKYCFSYEFTDQKNLPDKFLATHNFHEFYCWLIWSFNAP